MLCCLGALGGFALGSALGPAGGLAGGVAGFALGFAADCRFTFRRAARPDEPGGGAR